MIERLRRVRLPHVALATGLLFAAIPLSPAMGLIGFPPDATTPASAQEAAAIAPAAGTSPVTMMEAVSRHQQMLAAQSARQRREAEAARRRAAALARQQQAITPVTPVSSTDAIPTTDVTAKTREIQALVRKYFPADQLGNAMAVSACESGHADAKGAVNSDGTIDWGVFQLNDGGTLQGGLSAIGVSYSSKEDAQQQALDTATNVRAAASIYADRGWAPWVCAYKIGVVASLYGNAPGPMDGKFDEWGKPTVDVPVVTVDPGTTDPDDTPQGGDKGKGKDDDQDGDQGKGDKPRDGDDDGDGDGGDNDANDGDNDGDNGKPDPTPTPTATKSPQPTTSPTPTAPTQTPTP